MARTYTYSCTLSVYADERAKADKEAREIVDEFSASGEFSFCLHTDVEPIVEDD